MNEVLPLIDETLAKSERQLSLRPLEAARLFVDHFVMEVSGDTKDDYLTKPWFQSIFAPIYAWYERRYGEALTKRSDSSSTGMVLYFGTPLLFSLPLVLNEPGDSNTIWLRFPKEVFPNEDPLQWLQAKPPIESMAPKRRTGLKNEISEVATLLRGIHIDLMSADRPQAGTNPSLGTILRHFEKAAVDACEAKHVGTALAMWELQMACEKGVKGLLAQSAIQYLSTHDLRALHRLLPQNEKLKEARDVLIQLPTERRMIAWRYSEIVAPTTSEFFRAYLAALKVCSTYASQMKRKYVFNNAAFQLRKPPWFGP